MVTSALPGDGKTFTSINLALSMALERDVSVLLVDADVRETPRQRDIRAGGESRACWMRWWMRTWRPNRLIVPTTTRGFSILPAGRPVSGTAESC